MSLKRPLTKLSLEAADELRERKRLRREHEERKAKREPRYRPPKHKAALRERLKDETHAPVEASMVLNLSAEPNHLAYLEPQRRALTMEEEQAQSAIMALQGESLEDEQARLTANAAARYEQRRLEAYKQQMVAVTSDLEHARATYNPSNKQADLFQIVEKKHVEPRGYRLAAPKGVQARRSEAQDCTQLTTQTTRAPINSKVQNVKPQVERYGRPFEAAARSVGASKVATLPAITAASTDPSPIRRLKSQQSSTGRPGLQLTIQSRAAHQWLLQQPLTSHIPRAALSRSQGLACSRTPGMVEATASGPTVRVPVTSQPPSLHLHERSTFSARVHKDHDSPQSTPHRSANNRKRQAALSLFSDSNEGTQMPRKKLKTIVGKSCQNSRDINTSISGDKRSEESLIRCAKPFQQHKQLHSEAGSLR